MTFKKKKINHTVIFKTLNQNQIWVKSCCFLLIFVKLLEIPQKTTSGFYGKIDRSYNFRVLSYRFMTIRCSRISEPNPPLITDQKVGITCVLILIVLCVFRLENEVDTRREDNTPPGGTYSICINSLLILSFLHISRRLLNQFRFIKSFDVFLHYSYAIHIGKFYVIQHSIILEPFD
jgi:hypothetical protein